MGMLIWRICKAIMRRTGIHCWRICLRTIPDKIETPQLPTHLEFEVLDQQKMRQLAANHPGVSESFVDAAIERGDTCLVVCEVESEGGQWFERILGYSWRTQDVVEFMPNFWVRLVRPKTFFGFKSWVDPTVRGLRLFQKMRQYQDHGYSAMGILQGIAYVSVSNNSSWASMQRDPNYRQLGFLVHANWGQLAWTFTTAEARQWIAIDTK